MAKFFEKYLLFGPLLLSFGLCWQLNAGCQMGKWCAALMLCAMAVMTNHTMANHVVQCRNQLIYIFVLLGWCQMADVLSENWSASSLLWGMTLAASFIMGHRLNAQDFQKSALALTFLIIVALTQPNMGAHIPISIQLFDNPVGEAAALVMGWICTLPWLADVLKRTLTKRAFYIKLVTILSLFLFITIFLYFRSRTGFLAILIATSLFLFCTYGRNAGEKRLTVLAWIGLACIVAFMPILYSRNAASADGRLLTYRSMWYLCLQRPMCGWGSHAMEAHYKAAQARTLQTLGENSEYAWLAGDGVRPFNELLAWCMEYGLVGVSLASLVIWKMWKTCRKEYLFWMASIFMGWGVLGCFSYPSYYPYVSLLTLFALGICTGCDEEKHASTSLHTLQGYRISVCTLGAIGILFSAKYIHHEQRKEQWMEMASTDEAQALKAYSRYQKDLQKDTDVGYAYAAALNFNGRPTESLRALQALQGRLQNYDTELLAGDDELTLCHWESAQQHFNIAHHMVPIRFMPLYGLMQVYLGQGNIGQTKSTARLILHKPVKVPSDDVCFVKDEARKLLGANQ